MGLNIGQSAVNLSTSRSADIALTNRKVAAALSEANQLTGSNAEEEAARQAERTTSPQGLALRAININLEEARQLVPTLEEVQARSQQARTERNNEEARSENALRRERDETTREQRRPVETLRPEPSTQARRFEENAPVRRERAAERNAGSESNDANNELPKVAPRIDIFA